MRVDFDRSTDKKRKKAARSLNDHQRVYRNCLSLNIDSVNGLGELFQYLVDTDIWPNKHSF